MFASWFDSRLQYISEETRVRELFVTSNVASSYGEASFSKPYNQISVCLPITLLEKNSLASMLTNNAKMCQDVGSIDSRSINKDELYVLHNGRTWERSRRGMTRRKCDTSGYKRTGTIQPSGLLAL